MPRLVEPVVNMDDSNSLAIVFYLENHLDSLNQVFSHVVLYTFGHFIHSQV